MLQVYRAHRGVTLTSAGGNVSQKTPDRLPVGNVADLPIIYVDLEKVLISFQAPVLRPGREFTSAMEARIDTRLESSYRSMESDRSFRRISDSSRAQGRTVSERLSADGGKPRSS